MDIVLGAYVTEQDALDAMIQRPEPQEQMSVVEDGDVEHPWRLHWQRP